MSQTVMKAGGWVQAQILVGYSVALVPMLTQLKAFKTSPNQQTFTKTNKPQCAFSETQQL